MEYSFNFAKLLFDFLYILFAVNPVLASLIFLSWTSDLDRDKRFNFAHKSIFVALLVAAFVMFVFWRITGIVDTLAIVFRITGGLILAYMSVGFITGRSKYCRHQNSLWLFFSSPVVAGPATFIAVYNSITKNNFLMTLILLITVMLVTWITLVITAKYITKESSVSWLNSFRKNKCMRIILYGPLVMLSIQMMIDGSSELFLLIKEKKYIQNEIQVTRSLEEDQAYASSRNFGLMELVVELGTIINVKKSDPTRMIGTLLSKMINEGILIPRWFSRKPRDSLC